MMQPFQYGTEIDWLTEIALSNIINALQRKNIRILVYQDKDGKQL